jgi:hypothetical protein
LEVYCTWHNQDEVCYGVNVSNRASLRSEHHSIKTIDNWIDSFGSENEWILAFTVNSPRIWGLKPKYLCKRQEEFAIAFYMIFFFNLTVPTPLSLVGGPLSGNGCSSPNHIYVISLLLVALLTQFILNN